jgi:pimeloyl-ACP methyl ester carboxylesterase
VGPPISTHLVASTDGVELALHDLGGEGPPLLLCHPTGFHGMVWAPVAADLVGTYHVWAIDFRGHGDSSLPSLRSTAQGSVDWAGFGDDVLAVVDHLNATGPLAGAGHSMGGAALLAAEERRPGTFAGLWLFEPIVFPSLGRIRPSENPLANAARRRRATFPNRAAAVANYAAKPPLGGLHPAALEAYVQHGFRDLTDGTVGLKCLPETEAQIFEGGADNGVFSQLDKVKCLVTIAMSGDGGYPAQFAPTVAETVPDGRLEHHADLTHFGPMEDPATIAHAIRSALS